MTIDLKGRIICNYRVVDLIGEGGMATVWRAEHQVLRKQVAIKVLNPLIAADRDLVQRFIHEAQIQIELRHPGIVEIENFSSEPLAMVMELVEGRALSELIGRGAGPLPVVNAVPLMIQILDATAYAHSRGVIHRDLKPANVLVTTGRKVKMLDFGIAKILGTSTKTRTGAGMGTAVYMSPEQIKGARDADARSDIYSLGITFYEMLAGRPPFEGVEGAESDFEIRLAQVRKEPPDPREFCTSIPISAVAVVMRAIAKDPASRYDSASDLRRALSEATEGLVPSNLYALVDSATPLGRSREVKAESPPDIDNEETSDFELEGDFEDDTDVGPLDTGDAAPAAPAQQSAPPPAATSSAPEQSAPPPAATSSAPEQSAPPAAKKPSTPEQSAPPAAKKPSPPQAAPAAASVEKPRRSRKWVLWVGVALVVVAAAAGGLWLLQQARAAGNAEAEAAAGDRLTSTAAEANKVVGQWLSKRRGELVSFAGDATLEEELDLGAGYGEARSVNELLGAMNAGLASKMKASKSVQRRLEKRQGQLKGCSRILVATKSGNIVFSTDAADLYGQLDGALLARALKADEPVAAVAHGWDVQLGGPAVIAAKTASAKFVVAEAHELRDLAAELAKLGKGAGTGGRVALVDGARMPLLGWGGGDSPTRIETEAVARLRKGKSGVAVAPDAHDAPALTAFSPASDADLGILVYRPLTDVHAD